jgi:hypothetical protein
MGLNLHPTLSHEFNKRMLDRRYNVEYQLGNGKIQTLSNVLENADGEYFWFCSEEDGLDMIKQDRVLTMVCIRKEK